MDLAANGAIGILGGAFDPVHVGHLRCALEVKEQLELSQVRLVPSANPPHRDPHIASADQRLAMLEAALADEPGLVADPAELGRGGTSWTVETLEHLRSKYRDRSLSLIVGEDAFLGVPDWHRSDSLLDLAHIVVARRPGWSLPDSGPVADLLARYQTTDPSQLHAQQAGSIYVCEITQLEIASSVIRARVKRGDSVRYLTPEPVVKVIETSGCYAA